MTEEPPQPNAERPDDEAPATPPEADVPAEETPVPGDAAPSAGDEGTPAVDGPPTADDTPPPIEATPGPEAAPGDSAPEAAADAAPGDSASDAAPDDSAPEADATPGDSAPEAAADAAPDAPGPEAAGDAPDPAAERPEPEPAPTPGEGPSEPAAPAPSGPAGETVSEAPAPAEEAVPPVADAAPADAAEEAPPLRERPDRAPRPRGRRDREEDPAAEEVIPGANLEPDLVLDEPARTEDGDEFAAYQEPDGEPVAEAPAADAPAEGAPAPRSVLDLAADARYRATGKRKTSVARVILRPGSGTYTVNGRTLEVFFPRRTLQQVARSPLETAGYTSRMDVIAKIHGGGVSAQAGALRHGIARALVEADPNLRGELKRAGFLTRDARAKERKKAGLKKARKRPQFSKR